MSNVADDSEASNPTLNPDLETYSITNTENPGAVLVTTLFNGNNYLTWSKSMMIALCAKDKLSFIDGTCAQPTEDRILLARWKRADSMVKSWILNSMVKELSDAFLSFSTAKELWEELRERFGEANGPLLYQIEREISSFKQGNLTISSYYTKLKKLWDDLASLNPTPTCTCEAAKAITMKENTHILVQFLMGLNDDYEHVVNQVLLMEPLPMAKSSKLQPRQHSKHSYDGTTNQLQP
ncbi:hypothetical protein K2173_024166 [Erythroxylum novogranatense]|uniref:Retrotransposon Copia-like N-terminal domain-containing protein n=1 Tax=Erythroxylum novogranatense TaxID=1862640 RepID=A0AAV8UCC4_9ROSI|nr:hypothetical protein K2173_024166 [Erythroxylum novogranatense]